MPSDPSPPGNGRIFAPFSADPPPFDPFDPFVAPAVSEATAAPEPPAGGALSPDTDRSSSATPSPPPRLGPVTRTRDAIVPVPGSRNSRSAGGIGYEAPVNLPAVGTGGRGR
ncbi:hypothetical protein GCM10009557_40470 [Virgisporangium ochraceum]